MRWILFQTLLIGLFSLLMSPFVFSKDEGKLYEDLDGVFINALDQYPSLKKNEFSIGVDFLPVDPYWYGLGISGSYTRYLDKKWGWEVLNVNAIFQIEKSLLNGIAERLKLEPQEIVETTSYIISSNLKYVLSYGKNIFLDKYIRRNRTELIAGLGTIGTNQKNYLSVNLGFQIDFAINEKYSWKVEFIDYIAIGRSRGGFMDFATLKAQIAWRFK